MTIVSSGPSQSSQRVPWYLEPPIVTVLLAATLGSWIAPILGLHQSIEHRGETALLALTVMAALMQAAVRGARERSFDVANRLRIWGLETTTVLMAAWPLGRLTELMTMGESMGLLIVAITVGFLSWLLGRPQLVVAPGFVPLAVAGVFVAVLVCTAVAVIAVLRFLPGITNGSERR